MPDQLALRAVSNDSDFRALVDIAPVIIWVATPDGECTFLSRSWREFTGQADGEGLGNGWLAAIHPADHTTVREAFVNARARASRYQVEYRIRTVAGDYQWVLDSAAPIVGPSGVLQGYIGSIVDNQARKSADVERRKAERRLKVALEASAIGTWEWELPGNIFHFSDQALRIFGLAESSDAVAFERLRRLIHPDDLPEVVRLSAAALDPKVRLREPYRYRITRENDGETRWIEAQGETVFDEGADAPPSAYIGTFQDITEEVAQAQSLRDSAARLELALNAAQLAVWELDIANDRLAPSPALNRLYGFPEDAQPTSDEFRSRYAPGEQERLEQLGQEARARGETSIRAEVKHILPDGSVRWLLIQAQAAEPTLDGGPRVIGVAMDITQSKLHGEKLAVVAREMEHRVKNTLTLVQALVEQSFRHPRSTEEGKAIFFERLSAYARAMDLLARDAGQGAELSNLTSVALAPFQERGLQQIRISGPQVHLEPRLAAAMVLGLHELATNAMKYGALSVPDGRVDLSWSGADDKLDLVWTESGGPTVKVPDRKGFGSRLLGGVLLQGQAGAAELKFEPSGVRFHLSCSLQSPG
ncbi:PAS domain-containing protein [Devosia sp. PTR5]|uniref:Blue-light-activated histidine kinase n=1 Tax=Devosia oryzisoli TaxID=2774138 RepID=A0A927FU92_9HYPH|nr:PAS domain-containing protein [Devosia oryzisoli]MBD8064779.1 PAS domain-containing protein [Devosia oryzisoli]